MVVDKLPESPGDHHILKVGRAVESGHFRSKSLTDSKMATFPSDCLAKVYESRRSAGDGTLPGGSERFGMEVNVSRQIKTPLNGCLDCRYDADHCHGSFH